MRPLVPIPILGPPLIALVLACGGAESPADTASTGSPLSSSTTEVTTLVTTTSTGTDETPTTTTTQSNDFILFPDLHLDLQCSIFAQDCRPGEKCVPWANDGSNAWNATRCVPATGIAATGEPCTAPQGPTAGIDDCSAPSICWDVGDDNQGTCVIQCGGDLRDPTCPPQYTCGGDYSVLALCLPACDPLADDCDNSEVCIPALRGFLCVLAGNPGDVNELCAFANGCDQGLACLPPATVSAACDPNADGCCTPFCKFPDAPCPNPDQQCLPWFAPMQPIPAGYEDLGSCGIPE